MDFKIVWSLSLWVTFCIIHIHSKKIIGGEQVEIGEYPAIAKIMAYPSERHICGGTILSNEAIISAAHCYDAELDPNIFPERFQIMVGDVTIDDKNRSSSRQLLKFRKVFLHENYDMYTNVNDICIIFVQPKIQFSQTVSSMSMASIRPLKGTECQVLGWGMIKAGTTIMSKMLLVTTVTVVSEDICDLNINNYRPDMWICAGDLMGVNDACKGDSGGPLICSDTCAGIVSFGPIICAKPDAAAAYTDVAYYSSWIQQKMTLSFGSAVAMPSLKVFFLEVSIAAVRRQFC